MTRARTLAPRRGGSTSIRPGRVSARRGRARIGVPWGVALAAAFLAVASGRPARAAEVLRGPLADSAAVALSDVPDHATWGILAVSLDRGDTLLSLDPGRRLIPGSNQKLLTCGAFLREIRPGTRFETVLEARGKVTRKGARHGVRLSGDLVLRGSGMPDVLPLLSPGSAGLLDSLASLLRASGLERFEGTLWVDGTRFAREGYPRGWAVEDIPEGYGAPVNAILANGNAATVVATAAGGTARVAFDPPDTPLTLDGVVMVGGRGEPSWLTVTRDLCGRAVHVTGVVGNGLTIRRTVSVPDPDSTAGLWLLGAMRRAGIAVKAGVRLAGRGAAPDPTPGLSGADEGPVQGSTAWERVGRRAAAPVVALESPPAKDIVSAVFAYSLNPESEALLRWLDPAPRGKSSDRALPVLRQRLLAAGIDSLDISLVDGSGLSPQDLVTPRAIVRWLTALERDSTLGVAFSSLLSTPGARGTLEHRFNGDAPDPTLRAKTGTLTNVSALSGFAVTGNGDRVAFSILSNGNEGSTAKARLVEEALVTEIERFRRPVYGPPAPAPAPGARR